MDFSNFSQYIPLLKKYSIPVGLLCIGLTALVIGLISFFPAKQETAQLVDDSANVTTTTVSTIPKDITIDVEGAVLHAGLYQVKFDSRMSEAIKLAGGIDPRADSNWITQHLNLAAKLTDGQKIYIPHSGESVTGIAADNSNPQDSIININSASAIELDSLPGVGQTTALKIISRRPYNDINELVSKKVVNRKVFDEIKDKIAL